MRLSSEGPATRLDYESPARPGDSSVTSLLWCSFACVTAQFFWGGAGLYLIVSAMYDGPGNRLNPTSFWFRFWDVAVPAVGALIAASGLGAAVFAAVRRRRFSLGAAWALALNALGLIFWMPAIWR